LGVGFVLSAYLYASSFTSPSSFFSSPSPQNPSPDFGLPRPPVPASSSGAAAFVATLTVLMLGGRAPLPPAAGGLATLEATGDDVETIGEWEMDGEMDAPPELDREGTRSESEVPDALLTADRPRVVFSSLWACALTGSWEMGVCPVDPETGGRNAWGAWPEGAALTAVLVEVWAAEVVEGGAKYEVWVSGEAEGVVGACRFLRMERAGVVVGRFAGKLASTGEGDGVTEEDELFPDEDGVGSLDDGGAMEAPFRGCDTDEGGAVWLTLTEEEEGDEVS
jgi:hypothetical protein